MSGRGQDKQRRGGKGASGRGRGRGGTPTLPESATSAMSESVEALENKLCKSGANYRGLDTDSEFTSPWRPAYGVEGTGISVLANYMEVKTTTPANETTMMLYSYDISIKPEAAGRKCIQVVKLWLRQFLETVNSAERVSERKYTVAAVTDFRSRLITNHPIDIKDYTRQVKYQHERETQPRDGATEYTVALGGIASLRLSYADLLQYLQNGQNQSTAHPSSWTQAFNIIVNSFALDQITTRSVVGGRVFDITPTGTRTNFRAIGGGLEAMRGFFSSVRLATGRILINVNVTSTAFYQNVLLTQLMDAFAEHHGRRGGGNNNKNNNNNSPSQWTEGLLRDLDRFLSRVCIQPTHMNRSTQRYIFGLADPRLANRQNADTEAPPVKVPKFGAGPRLVHFWASASRDEPFPGEYTSVYDYFAKTYPNCPLQEDYPVVNVGSLDHPVFFPADVCLVEAGQAARSKLDREQTSNMISFAVRPPTENAVDIVQLGPKVLGFSDNGDDGSGAATLGAFQLQVNPQLVKVPARILQAPNLAYKTSVEPLPQTTSWSLKDTQFGKSGSLGAAWECFAVIPIQADWDQIASNVRQSVGRFQQKLKEHGITAERVATLSAGSEAVLKVRLGNAAKKGIKLVLVVLPDTSAAMYSRVKTMSDVEFGVCTVCVVYKSFTKADNSQYLSNVALKVNLKLGGCNQKLMQTSQPAGGGGGGAGRSGMGRGPSQPTTKLTSPLAPVNPNTTMLVGIDVTHPSPGSQSSAPSIAAMVASMDATLSQWPAELRVQRNARDEMVDELQDMLVQHLHRWQARNDNTLPKNVLVYRDGVSEGQYQIVVSAEIPQLRRAFEAVYGPKNAKLPLLTVLMVGKRHHTRFFPSPGDSTHSDKIGNPLPGTVVDRGVTFAPYWNFFLQSHRAIQGTARPAHYFVLCDEIFRSKCKDASDMKALAKSMKKVTLGVDLSKKPGGGGSGSDTCPQNPSDALQRVTQALCYIYGRSTGPVSIATPAYYADLACTRARCYLSDIYDAEQTRTRGQTKDKAGTEAEQEARQQRFRERIKVHDSLKGTMFYI